MKDKNSINAKASFNPTKILDFTGIKTIIYPRDFATWIVIFNWLVVEHFQSVGIQGLKNLTQIKAPAVSWPGAGCTRK